MILSRRKEILTRLGEYLKSNDEQWQAAKSKASISNPWFIPEFIDLAANNIAQQFLQPEALDHLAVTYSLDDSVPAKRVGIVMAGNIPMVGFHDLLCVFITGNAAVVKPSSKDDVLIPFLIRKMASWDEQVGQYIRVSELLKGCDAYIATGSNNSATHFEYYFRNHPNIIRKNRTSVAVLKGNETEKELEQLADDVHLFFGLGCRNITKIYVPQDYNFEPLLKSFEKYHRLANLNKYKNNFDYNLALHILNKREYMTNGSILLVEDKSYFSPISQLHYEYYSNEADIFTELSNSESIQTVVGAGFAPLGSSQAPGICTFADDVDTIEFLQNLQ